MNSQAVSKIKNSVRGFTLIEILLVISIMTIIGVFVPPIGMSFYRAQQLNETSDGLMSALRQAQIFALTDKGNQSYGVYIQQDKYVVFKGAEYATRVESEDLVFPIATSVSVVGPSEVVFSELTGEPSVTGNFVISSVNRERQIKILTSGNIDR